MAKSRLQKNKCWEWTGNISRKGYGHFMMKRKTFYAHRVSYLLFNGGGLLPKNIKVLHQCDNPKCINPDHLFLGTDADNSKDRNSKERQARGESHAKSKISEKDVKKIRELNLSGMSIRAISKKFPIDESNISRIINKKTWKHL